MKKRLWLVPLILMGCSSGPKAGDKDAPEADYSDLSTSPAGESRSETEPKPVEASHEKPKTTSSADSEELSEAIKTNNEEAIYRSSIQILSKNAGDVRALNALGLYHYRKNHWSAAQMMFGKALKLSPNNSELHNNLGLVLLAQKEQREAIKEFRKALEINPNDANAASNIGSIYVEEKDYTKALVASEIAYRKNSKDQRVLNNYAIALTAAGKFPEAKDIYRQAMRLNENNKDVMFNYAFLLIEKLNQNQEGLDLLNKVKFLGTTPEVRNKINVLENKAKAGIK